MKQTQIYKVLKYLKPNGKRGVNQYDVMSNFWGSISPQSVMRHLTELRSLGYVKQSKKDKKVWIYVKGIRNLRRKK